MFKPQFQSEKTKLEAYRLVHDPNRLFSLLFLKYGDIDEDYNIFYANQVVYNEFSHFNTTYKEHLYNYYEEFMKKYYNYKETKKRMIKLNEYYKNYLKFFSKPIFVNSYYNKIINHYYDSKAEIFYINNFSKRKISKNIKRNKNHNNIDSYISSIDNDTYNDIIFNKRIRKMIDHNLDSKSCTITLDINTKNDLNYINNKNISNSLINIVDNFVNNKNKTNNKKNNNSIIHKISKELVEIKHNLNNENKNKIDKDNELSKSIKDNKNKILIDSKNIDELKEKTKINSDSLRNKDKGKDKEKYFNIEKEQINKINIHIKNQNIKLFINEKNSDDKNNLEKLKINNFNMTNHVKFINNNNQKELSPLYNNLEQNNIDKRKISKSIFAKKNLSIGLNLNLFKNPLYKVNYINFYSPKINSQNIDIFNNLNSLNNNNINNRNNINNNKNKSLSNLSDILVKPFISVNLENAGKRFYNKKYKLMPRKNNINNIKSIQLNINSKSNKLNNFTLKNFKIRTPTNIKNKSTEIININEFNNLNIKNLSHNLSEEKNLNINLQLSSTIGRKNKIFTIQNNFFKKLSPSFSRNKEKNIFTKDNNQKLDIKNKIDNNFMKQTYRSQNRYIFEDFKKVKDNNNKNLVGKKVFYPINFKKSFNKKEIVKNNKDGKLV